MECCVKGGGWITSSGWGRIGEETQPVLPDNEPLKLPGAKEIFDRSLARYGRYDDYTRLGLGAMALALRDAGYTMQPDKSQPVLPVGIISQSRTECIETDRRFYETTLESDGALSSPNLFSYTLPGIVQGECAVHYGLGGPTFCLSVENQTETLGAAALIEAIRILRAGKAEAMLAGWIEAPSAEATDRQEPLGAAFVLLSTDGGNQRLQWDGSDMRLNGQSVHSVFDILTRQP